MADTKPRRVKGAAPAGAYERFRAGLLADTGLSLVRDEPRDFGAKVLRHNGASLALEFAAGLLIARYSGPITPEFLGESHAWGEDAPGCSADAVLVDFTAATLLFGTDDLCAVMHGTRVQAARRPRALLVTLGQCDMVQEYAIRFALKGVLQRCFLDRNHATAWARAEAALRD